MNFRQVRCLRGPNVWAACSVIEGALDFGNGSSWSPQQVWQTTDRVAASLLDTKLPGAEEGDAPLLRLARVFGLAAIRLQVLAENSVSFAAVGPSGRPGVFPVAIEFAEEPVGLAAVETALRLFLAARDGGAFRLEEDIRRLRDLAYEQLLPASTAVIYDAARARGIPAARLSPDYGRYLRLGQGAKQHRCLAAEPDDVSAVARMASTDKHLAKELLQAAGVPVPRGRLVSTVEEAWAAACELGPPVAVKPQDADLATGVSLDLHTREQVDAAFEDARRHSSGVLVERFAPGMEHRVLVVADRVVAVTRIEPPQVVGDGRSTVAELVAEVNRDPRRGGAGSGAPLSQLRLDETAVAALAAQGYTPASVPPAGKRVLVRRNPPYFKNGGNLIDLTDRIHPGNVGHAVAAAQALQLRVAGLDVVALDIARPLEEQGGVVVEINVSPGLWLHMAPWADCPRPVGEEIVASMFPPGSDGRIPVAAIVGDSSGAAMRHLTALLGSAGCRVGSASATEIIVGRRHWSPPAGTPQQRAGIVLQNPVVDAALLATSPGELVRAGFGNDRCNVALVLDPQATGDASGADAEGVEIGVETGEFVHALRHALAPDGVFVLAADGKAAGIETHLPAARILLVAGRPDHPRVRNHLAAGGRALVVQGDAIAWTHGSDAPVLLGKRPRGMTDREGPALLAALAAASALGHSAETLKAYLGCLP